MRQYQGLQRNLTCFPTAASGAADTDHHRDEFLTQRAEQGAQMLKLLVLLLGVTGGAAGATAYLLSEPDGPTGATRVPDQLRERLDLLKARFSEATTYGEREREVTEERLRREIEAYRRPLPPPTASS